MSVRLRSEKRFACQQHPVFPGGQRLDENWGIQRDIAAGESKGQNWESDRHNIVVSLATHRWRICRAVSIFL